MTDTDPLQSYVAELGERVDYLAQLDLTVEEGGDGRVVVSVPATDRFVDSATGIFQGGVTATLIDVVGGLAIRSTFEAVDGPRLATTNLQVSYLRPADGDVRVVGEVASVGSTLGTASVAVENAQTGEEVASALANYRLFD